MCIVCNTADVDASLDFLGHFARAQAAMQAASAAMLKCSQVATLPDARKSYDRAHKQMRRLAREWNAIEHSREPQPAKPPVHR